MKRVAILIPAYNAENTIVETLSSLEESLGSSDSISKIFLADDCSSDSTVSLCKKNWCHPTIHLTILPALENGGERRNINRVIPLLQQEYDWILLIHADDIVKPNWVKEMSERINSSDDRIASICSSYDLLWPDGRIREGENKSGIVTIEGNRVTIRHLLMHGTWWHISGCAINTRILTETGGFNPDMPQYGDMEWILRVFTKGHKVEYIPKSLTLYRRLPTTVSSNSFKIHRDIYEHTSLIIKYKELLTLPERLLLYLRFVYYLVRRAGKSVIQGRRERAGLALRMAYQITKMFIGYGMPV